jgi:hypothetical protein
MLSISVSKLDNMARAGEIARIQMAGRAVRYSPETLRAWIKVQEGK